MHLSPDAPCYQESRDVSVVMDLLLGMEVVWHQWLVEGVAEEAVRVGHIVREVVPWYSDRLLHRMDEAAEEAREDEHRGGRERACNENTEELQQVREASRIRVGGSENKPDGERWNDEEQSSTAVALVSG